MGVPESAGKDVFTRTNKVFGIGLDYNSGATLIG